MFSFQGQIENEVVHEILRIIFEIEDANDNAPTFEPSDLQGRFRRWAMAFSQNQIPKYEVPTGRETDK